MLCSDGICSPNNASVSEHQVMFRFSPSLLPDAFCRICVASTAVVAIATSSPPGSPHVFIPVALYVYYRRSVTRLQGPDVLTKTRCTQCEHVPRPFQRSRKGPLILSEILIAPTRRRPSQAGLQLEPADDEYMYSRSGYAARLSRPSLSHHYVPDYSPQIRSGVNSLLVSRSCCINAPLWEG
ncbi:hypothetical protein BC628DRAFT_782113 [Trametes gibbosa]|nr:hypothetical protein BC628DRAFT_782113 [Trametes gibbosa]